MSKSKVEKYKPEVCPHCAQSTTYLLGLDKGSVEILLDILKFISAKGINELHPKKETDWATNKEKTWFLTNLSRPRFHGLIAYMKNKKGYYCLTKKAGQFLRGKPIPQFAIISKATGHQIGYWKEFEHQITLRQVLRSDELPYWEGSEQRMIEYLDPIERSGQQTLSFNFVLRQERVNA